MIVAEHLSKHYGTKTAVADLSLHVEPGTVLGFIGPNGAGKTTTMKMLCGVMPPASGTVRIGSYRMEEDPVQAKALLGYLPENAPLFTSMTVRAFLLYCGKMRGLASKTLRDAFDRAVESCFLQPVLHEELEALSKGYRRRVCLAQAVMHAPRGLILDEPTDGLDPNQKREIRSLIASMRKNSAIIVSTHILEEVDAVCDRVLLLVAGRKVFDGSTASFRALSPDDGAVSFTLVSGDPQSALAALKAEFGDASIREQWNRETRISLKLRPADLPPEQILSKLYAFSAGKTFMLEDCEILRGRLDEVFARLSEGVPS